MNLSEIDDSFDFEWDCWKWMPETMECRIVCEEGIIILMVDGESLEGLVSIEMKDDFHHEESWHGTFNSLTEAKNWCMDKAKSLAQGFRGEDS